MLKQCEKCWETYETERTGANEYLCSKCMLRESEVEDGW